MDPKGLLHTQGFDDPKISFSSRVKELEARLRKSDPNLTLNSFIISSTSLSQIHWWDKLRTKEDFAAAHILFQKVNSETYLREMFARMDGRT